MRKQGDGAIGEKHLYAKKSCEKKEELILLRFLKKIENFVKVYFFKKVINQQTAQKSIDQ
jgi:hypothetical protein